MLESEDVLDKIRAEIEALPKTYPFINHIDAYVKEDDVKRIIDKHKAENEVKKMKYKRSKTDSVLYCPYCGRTFRMTTERYLHHTGRVTMAPDMR